MRDVILYIAMSLDGYLAAPDGSVDWLAGQDPDRPEEDDGYSRFVAGVDTVVMGYKTYEQIVTSLSPDRWVYEGLTSYVITHRSLPASPNIRFTSEDPCTLVDRLRRQPGKSVWICGGASIIQPLIARNFIDVFRISVIPTLLGDGIRLFEAGFPALPLRLLGIREENGIAELTYVRRTPAG